MTNEQKMIALEKLMEDEAFASAMAEVESKTEMQAVFATHGLELTREEIDAFVVAAVADNNAELNETSLEDVSGGGFGAAWIFSQAYTGIKKFAKKAWNLGKAFAEWEENRY